MKQEIKQKDGIIEEVRCFFKAASRQFEKQGVYLKRVHFDRENSGECNFVELAYEERDLSGTEKTEAEYEKV